MTLTQTQITKLGDRIRSGNLLADDDRLLADYLLSFSDFAAATYAQIVALIPTLEVELAPFGASVAERTIKSSRSIADKLARMPETKLNRMQDIVGCRIIVLGTRAQDTVLSHLAKIFSKIDVKDRRESPANGYRALHAVIRSDQMRYEVQIRSALQHLWATNVELLISKYGIGVKYGEGPKEVQLKLVEFSEAIAAYEAGPDSEPGNYNALRPKLDEFEKMLEE